MTRSMQDKVTAEHMISASGTRRQWIATLLVAAAIGLCVLFAGLHMGFKAGGGLACSSVCPGVGLLVDGQCICEDGSTVKEDSCTRR